MIRQITSAQLRWTKQELAELPPLAREVCERALAKGPQARYMRPLDLADALEPLVQERQPEDPARARLQAAQQQAGTPDSDVRTIALGALLLAFLVGLGLLMIRAGGGAEQPSPTPRDPPLLRERGTLGADPGG